MDGRKGEKMSDDQIQKIAFCLDLPETQVGELMSVWRHYQACLRDPAVRQTARTIAGMVSRLKNQNQSPRTAAAA
jgi:hypothetical protein